MQWLPQSVVARLARHHHALVTVGARVSRSDLVAALVLDWDIVEPDDLRSSIHRYRAKHLRPGTRRTDGSVPVTLRLPSPLSRRIDGLVVLARRETIAYRHDLIGTAIVASRDAASTVTAFERYQSAKVREAAVPGLDLGYVLETERPHPGPRPLLA